MPAASEGLATAHDALTMAQDEAARVAKPPPKPLLSDRPSDMGSPLVEDEYTDRSLGYSGEASWSPSN